MIGIDSLNNKTNIRLRICQQMSCDLNLLLESYKNKDIGTRLISEKINVGEKTLKRILKLKSVPHINTIQRFYQYYFLLTNISSENHPLYKEINELIQIEELDNAKELNFYLEGLLEKDKVFRKIYLLSRTGVITRNWIQDEFGNFGLEHLELMLKNNILLEIDKDTFVEGSISISKGPKSVKSIISDLVEDHLSSERLSEKGLNSAFYMVDRVTEDAYESIIEITEQYKKNVAKLIQDKSNRGLKRIFVSTAVDNIDNNLEQ